jgi:hypothetical protein
MGLPLPVRKKPPLPPGAERRHFERFELLAQVELRHHDEVALLPIVNISAGGILLSAERGEAADLGVGEEVSVFLDVSDLPEPIELTMDAAVVRVTAAESGSSIALMWTGTNGVGVSKLAKLLDWIRTRDAQ